MGGTSGTAADAIWKTMYDGDERVRVAGAGEGRAETVTIATDEWYPGKARK